GRVTFEAVGDGRTRFDAPTSFVFSDVCSSDPGALGTTEILLRSRERGLAVSPRLGERFTGNGDVLAFSYGIDVPIPPLRGIGAGGRPRTPEAAVGPCITGRIDLTHPPSGGRSGMLVEEGVIPGALRWLMPAAFAVAADIYVGGGPGAFARQLPRPLEAPRRAVHA